MLNRSVSLCAVVALLMGLSGICFIGASCTVSSVPHEYFGLGLLLVLLAVGVDIRASICRLSRQVEEMESREANAFHLGRDSVRALR